MVFEFTIIEVGIFFRFVSKNFIETNISITHLLYFICYFFALSLNSFDSSNYLFHKALQYAKGIEEYNQS